MKDLGEMSELAINYFLKNSHNSAKMLGLVMGYILSTGGYIIFLTVRKLSLICITIWQGSLEVNTSTVSVLTCLVLFHTDRLL